MPARLWPLLLIGAALAVFFGAGLHERMSFASFAGERAALDALVAGNRVGALLLFTAAFAALVALSLPVSFVLSVIAGYLFGPLLAIPAALVSITAGSTLFLLLTRGALGDLLRGLFRRRLDALADGFRRDAVSYLVLARLIPVAPVYLTNLAVGLVGMRLRDFVLATFVGLIPVTIVFAFVGEGLRTALDAGAEADPAAAARRIFLAPEVLLSMLGLAALAIAPILLRRRRRV